jgi:hypothetical protein
MNNSILALIPRQFWHRFIRANWVSWADVQEILAVGLPDKTEFPNENEKENDHAKNNLLSSSCAHNLSAPYEFVAKELPDDHYNWTSMGMINTQSGEQWNRFLSEHPSIPVSVETMLTREGLIHPNVTFEWLKDHIDAVCNCNTIGNNFVMFYSLVRSSHLAEDIAWLDATASRFNITINSQQRFLKISMEGKIFYEDAVQQLSYKDMQKFKIYFVMNAFTIKMLDWTDMLDDKACDTLNWEKQLKNQFNLSAADICSNYTLTIEHLDVFMKQGSVLSWDALSYNPAFTLDIIRSFPEGEWDWNTVFMNPSLTPEDVKWLLDNKEPNYEYLRRNQMRNDLYYTTFLPHTKTI